MKKIFSISAAFLFCGFPFCASAATQYVFLTPGSGSWTVPAGWAPTSTVEVIGGGGGGAGGIGTGPGGYYISSSAAGGGGGGGGGAYSESINLATPVGMNFYYSAGAGGSPGAWSGNGGNGGDSYFCISNVACSSIAGGSVITGAKGGSGGTTAPGQGVQGGSGPGGLGSSGIATGTSPLKYNGGAGGSNYGPGCPGCVWAGGSGGGGAGGPHGNGAQGSMGTWPAAGGGGGGGYPGGQPAANPYALQLVSGGNNFANVGGGAPGSFSSPTGGSGSSGGGGGPGYTYESTSGSGAGGTGGTGSEWDSTHGSGGGGGGGGEDNEMPGGSGGLYGGGGGGGGAFSGSSWNGGSSGGAGAPGIVVISYTPPSCVTTFVTSPLPYGQSTTLGWTSSSSIDVYINSVGYVGLSGTITVAPLAATNYSCSAGNGTSTTTNPATLYVGPAAYISQSAGTTDTQTPYTITATSSNATACTTYAQLPGSTEKAQWSGTNTSNSTTTSVAGTTTWWNVCSNSTNLISTSTLTHTIASSCTLNGEIVQSGSSYTFFSTQSAPSGQLCSAYSQSRTCNNGTLSGSSSYQYASCSCAPSYSCSGQQIQYTNSSCTTSNYGSACISPAYCQSGASSCDYPAISFNPSGSQSGNLELTPTVVHSGKTIQVYWSVSNAQSCSVTGTNGDHWSALASPNAGETSSAITGQTTYTLSCTAYSPNPNVTESQVVNLTPTFLEE